MNTSQISLSNVPAKQLDILKAILWWMKGQEQMDFKVGMLEEDEKRVLRAQRDVTFLQAEADAVINRTANKRQLKDWARYARVWAETTEEDPTWWDIRRKIKDVSLFQFRMQCRELNQSLKELLKA